MRHILLIVILVFMFLASPLSGKNLYIAEIPMKDSINGIYIPKDMRECFLELDKLLSEEDRKWIKNLENRDETIELHHSLGRWIRNNWGLWDSGARLSKYLIDKGLKHPDEMSVKILEFYYDWLHEDHDAWQKWENGSRSSRR